MFIYAIIEKHVNISSFNTNKNMNQEYSQKQIEQIIRIKNHISLINYSCHNRNQFSKAKFDYDALEYN